MKKICLITLISFAILSFSTLQAQEKKTKINRVYMFGTVGPFIGDGTATSYGLSGVINNKWIVTYGKLYAKRNSTLPPDFKLEVYEVPWYLLIILPVEQYYDFRPEDETRFTYASFGRYYPVSRKISFILDGGIGIAKSQGANYYKPGQIIKSGENIVPGVSSNYIVTKTEKTSIGGIVRAGADWAFSGCAGAGLDLYYNANMGGIKDNMGFNLRLMLGYMPRPAKKAVMQ